MSGPPTPPPAPPAPRPRTAGGGHPHAPGRRVALVAAALRSAASRRSFVEDEIDGVAAYVGPGDVCLDIGAEYGLYTWILSRLVGSAGRVHSVEPLPGPARWLTMTAAALGAGNVTVHRVAMAERAFHGALSLPRRRALPVHGRAYLVDGASGPGSNAEFRASRLVAAPVDTVDGLCRRENIGRVAFLKADVEGAEGAVLAGAREILERDRPALLLEIEDRHLARYGRTTASITGPLRDLGYTMHRWENGGWRPVTEVTPRFRNHLFLR